MQVWLNLKRYKKMYSDQILFFCMLCVWAYYTCAYVYVCVCQCVRGVSLHYIYCQW